MLALILFTAAFSATECSAKAPQVQALVLKQNHADLGDFVVATTANGVRLDAIGNGYSIVSKAPKWDVFVLNKQTRKYYTCSLDKWIKGGHAQSLASAANSEVYTAFPWTTLQATPIKFQGVIAESRVFLNKNAGKKRMEPEMGLSSSLSIPTKRYQFICMSDRTVASAKRDMVVRAVYMMPAVGEIPLALLQHRVDSSTAAIFNTTKISRESKDVYIFDLPAGFERTEKYVDVTAGSDKMDAVKDLFNN